MRSRLLFVFVFVGLLQAPASALPPVSKAWVKVEYDRVIQGSKNVSALQAFARLTETLPLLPVEKQIKLLKGLTGKRVHPLLKTQGLIRLFPFVESPEKVRQMAKAHGFVSGWSVSSPQPSGPGRVETEHRDFMQQMASANKVELKKLEHHGSGAFISLDHLLPTHRQHVLHAVATITVSKRESIGLFLGTSGDIAVSVGGRYAGGLGGLRESQPDQLVVPLDLEPGKNVVVVSIAPSMTEKLHLYARIGRRTGHPNPRVVIAPWHPSDGWHPLGGDQPSLRPIVDDLRRPKSHASRLRRALLKRRLGLPDKVGVEQRSLEDLLLTPEFAALPPEELLLALEFVPALEAKKSILLHYWTQGRREPSFALALSELCAIQENTVAARKWLDRGGSRLAGEHHHRVAAKVWRYGNEAERAWLYVSPDAYSGVASEALLHERALAARRLGRIDVSQAIWREIANRKNGSIEVVGALVEDLQGLGQGQQALERLELLSRRHPHVASLAFESIRLALALKKKEKAYQTAQSLRSTLGANLSVIRNLALSYEDIGEEQEAIQLYQMLLNKAPNDPLAREGLRRLTNERTETSPLPALDIKLRRRAPSRTGAPYEVLEDATHVRLHDDGSYSKHRRRLIRVQRILKSRTSRTISERYDPSQVRLSVLQARIHRGDVAIESIQREERQISKAWYGLYYDQREVSFVLDDPKIGDIVELTTRTESVGSHPIPGAYEFLRFLQGRSHIHEVTVTMDIPRSLKLRTQLNRGGGNEELIGRFTLRETMSKQRKELILSGLDIPPLMHERKMPGIAELVPFFQATTFSSFKELADEYSKLVDSQRILTNAMREWLEQKKSMHVNGDGSINRTEFLRSVVEGIAQEIRYVGLEFGIHGFQPYRTDQVWVRRFGDCKDQATLLSTLLTAAGIPAKVALMRTRPWGRIDNPLPALGLFDHAIVWLPESQQYVDTTERTMGLGTLPAADIGAQVLVLDSSPPQVLIRTPVPNPLSNGTHSDYSVVVRADASGELSGRITFHGVAASKQRTTYANKSKQVHRVAQMVNNRYPGSNIKSHSFTNLSDLERPLKLSLSAHLPTLGVRTSKGIRLRQPLGGANFSSLYAPTDTRSHPIVLGSPSNFRFRYHYILPAGWTVSRLPTNHQEVSPFGSYRIQWQREPGAVRGELQIRLDQDQVSAKAYPKFYRFMQRLHQRLKPDLNLRAETGGHP